ncbi:MAG: UDP-N-acetylmuramate dehydrogenase [Bacteroidetes bacterium]|nr:UDP-N-acetylmuramate dehydrogenase [Bacteroidota bacterium]
MNIENEKSLTAFNTFGIAAVAAKLVTITDINSAREALEFCNKTNLQSLILGGGSNILFTKNPESLILLNRLRGIEIVGKDGPDRVLVKAAAGETWHEFVQYCIRNNWGGLENLSLIPGMVGASPMQNIGAYGVEIKDVFHSLEALSLENGNLKTFNSKECNFGYRESVFKNTEKNKWLISSVTFSLSAQNHQLHLDYGAIRTELEKAGIAKPEIADVSNAVISIRKSKLPDPAEIGNAGSFFKNPVVEISVAETIKSKYPELVSYPVNEHEVKLAAGWLIEKAGWKGYREGDAGVHKNQALVLVNYGNAGGNEILNLSTRIINDISDKFGVVLEREVNII